LWLASEQTNWSHKRGSGAGLSSEKDKPNGIWIYVFFCSLSFVGCEALQGRSERIPDKKKVGISRGAGVDREPMGICCGKRVVIQKQELSEIHDMRVLYPRPATGFLP
jgi:hypothetical protein